MNKPKYYDKLLKFYLSNKRMPSYSEIMELTGLKSKNSVYKLVKKLVSLDFLKKRIQEMKYKWEKDDEELEQKIVSLESKLTMIQQKDKGVIKVSNKKRIAAKEKELAFLKKKYEENIKK